MILAYSLPQLFGPSNSSKNARTAAYATMPPNQDRYEVSLDLVTIAGTEYAMQANLTQYEDVAELEDDILCFLPTVSDLDVFGCELDLLDLHTQQPLPEAFRTGHVEVAIGIQHVGIAAWQSCQQLQIVRVPPSEKSCRRDLPGVLCAERGGRPGVCPVQPKSVCGVLLPRSSWCQSRNGGAQLGKCAFESCLTLTTITFDMDHTNKPRALPEGAFCGAGIEQLCLPSDFHNIGPRACENCKRLVEVNLMGTEITALLYSTFAHCVALNCVWLPPRLTQIGKEVFLNCVVLQEVVIPTELSDIGNRAFCGCEQLQRFTPLDCGKV